MENNLLTYNKYINQIQITVSLLNVLEQEKFSSSNLKELAAKLHCNEKEVIR